MDTKNSFWLKKGIHDGIPIALGYLSVGFTLGITARHAGLTPFQATITSLFMNASAGEFAGFTMISGKAGYVEAGIMMLIINARYLLMSCALSQKLGSSASVLHRMLMGYDVTDELYELPAAEFKARLNTIVTKIEQNTPADEDLKVLMITHKVLASQQGYEQLLDILNDALRNKEDPFLIFFADTIESIYHALDTSNTQLLFDTLGIKRYPIAKKSEKTKWKMLYEQLTEVRTQKAIDVLKTIIDSQLIPIPPKVDGWYRLYMDAPETMYASKATIQQFLQLDYAQFIAVRDFLYPDAQFSTEHGVKGEEYDNVVFVISKGWNQYQFETYAPMITGHASIPKGKEASYERNRNLFYVCCSRPKKRLFFFVTVPIDSSFRTFLVKLAGKENILTYRQFMEASN